MKDLVLVADYKVDGLYGGQISITLYRGMVGGTTLGQITVEDTRMRYLEPACREEYLALCERERLPDGTPVMHVAYSFVHASLWRRGFGVWLYAEAARLAWVLRSAVITQDLCRGSQTSLQAMRVWASSEFSRYVRDAHQPGDYTRVVDEDYGDAGVFDAPRVVVWRRERARGPVPAPSDMVIRTEYRENPGLPRGVVAPDAVRKEFAQGLALHARGLKGKGLRPETVAEARDIARGAPVDPEKLGRMRGWFARHGASPREVAARRRQAAALAAGRPLRRAPALVAWLLWGGDAGQRWVKSLR